jgi:putative hydrolase of HD superfamily
MAVLLRHEFPEVDFSKLIRICVVHDLGEAVAGDVPAVDQEAAAPKAAQERLDLLDILAPLPGGLRAELVSLWDDYESATSAEARLAKAMDKLETIMQHNQGLNPENFVKPDCCSRSWVGSAPRSPTHLAKRIMV